MPTEVFDKMPEPYQQLLLDSLVKSGAVVVIVVQTTRYTAARYVKRASRVTA